MKPAAMSKTRLGGAAVDRTRLARAIALDTIAAAAACEAVARVVVVTDDDGLVVDAAGIPRLHCVPEGGARGLDGAVLHGMAAAEGMPRAALLGDLPALRPEDLTAALRHAASFDRAVVADAEGTGSTLVTARVGVKWASAFGDGSFARHVRMGCVAMVVPAGSSLRRDVDTAQQLEIARALGLGPRTAGLLP
nr:MULTISPECIES: 2-phospho-L-lactate guanylyltransferase [Microbacterium]